MGANKASNHKKCGEILMDINSKNKKNKTFLFHCTLCDLECDTLKKFSLHIGDYHLKNSIEILEAEIKFEKEEEEFGDCKTSTINVFENDRDGQVNTNPDPLDTLNTASSSKGLDFLNCEVKNELEECSNDESSIFDTEVIDSDKEIEKNEIAKTYTDTNFGGDTNSESEDFDQTPFKKQKLNSDKKDINLKPTNDNSSDESKDPEYTQLVIKRMHLKTNEIYSLEPEKELCNTCFDAKYYMDVLFKLQTETINEQKKKILDALAAQNSLTKMLLKQEETSKSLNDMFPISSEATLMDIESQINEHNKYLYVTAIKDLINKNISKNICRVISEEFLYTYNVDGTHGKKRLKNFIMFYDVLKQAVKNSNPEIDDIESEIRKAMEKESNAIKKHKRCKRRWKNIDDTILPLLIEMYKKYEVLWQVNDIAFGILPKRNETFEKMIEELKAKHDFNKNLDELQDYIDYINFIFYNDKEQELKCELDKTEFKATSKYYKELSFLNDSQGPFKCPNCNEIITKYDRFHVHVAQHTGSIPFQCRLCEMGFQKFDNYLRHVTRHLGINSYHCNVCGKGYPFKSELDWHLTSHTGVKPYLCPICGAGFRARHGYDNHIRRHEKRFRYECHICKHGFNHLCKLNTHIKSHLNIRDVICNVCGKGFTAAKYLQRHKLIHEEEKRYKCNVCGKAFAQDSGLRTHRKQHQPYSMIAENKNLLNKCI